MGNGVLVVNGSPRKDGNTSFLVTRSCEVFRAGGIAHEAISLGGMDIRPCTGCDACRAKKSRYCVFKDDMAGLYDKVAGCDAILFASPVYWFAYTAQLKAFVDRLYGLWNWDPDFLKGKKAGALLVYGDVDVYASGAINAISSFEHMLRFLRAEIAGFAYGTANEPGDAGKNADLVERTEGLARKLLPAR